MMIPPKKITWFALAPKPLSSELLTSGGASTVHHRSTTNVAGSSSLNSFTKKISVFRLTIFQSVNGANTPMNFIELLQIQRTCLRRRGGLISSLGACCDAYS